VMAGIPQATKRRRTGGDGGEPPSEHRAASLPTAQPYRVRTSTE